MGVGSLVGQGLMFSFFSLLSGPNDANAVVPRREGAAVLVDNDDGVAGVHGSHFLGRGQGAGDVGLLAADGRHALARHSAADAHVLDDVRVRRAGDDGADGSAARDVASQVSVRRQAHDGGGAELHGEQVDRARDRLLVGHRPVRAGNALRKLLPHGGAAFRLEAQLRHDLHAVDRVLAVGRLPRQHHTVAAVQHRVDDVRGLRPGGPREVDHGLQHLGRGDDRLGGLVAPLDHVLLRQADLLNGDFHAQVAAGDHDAVGLGDDFVDVAQALHVLDLGDNLDVPSGLAQHSPALPDIIRRLREGERDEVEIVGDCEVDDVVDVLLPQDWEVDLDARQVHVLLFADGGVVEHLDYDVGVVRLSHRATQASIGDEDGAPDADRLGQQGVRARDALVVPLHLVVGRDLERLPLRKRHWLVLLEQSGSDLRPLGVQQQAQVGFRALLHGFAHHLERLALRLVVSMGEVEAADVHSRVDEGDHRLRVGDGGSHGTDHMGPLVFRCASIAFFSDFLH
ncbi:uncharacterized protein BcabD6B2_04040 [Babesia caballi]|uniref:Uncharacterized protein n=1 Tax=Babesia caballi TaxID=5871 RepID=A0AAV4LM08_BABCB|nr:hypothetical protein BcabD6B2_04040 [Babesia caballi]